MSTVEENVESRTDHSITVLKALILASVVVQGAYRYIPGPSLIDLVARIPQPFQDITLLYCARAIGQIVGTILGINAICLHSKFFGRTFFCLISCFYGFGAFLAPVLAKYYVEERVNITSEILGNRIKNDTEIQDAWKIPHLSTISMAYIIIAIMILLIAFLWLLHYNFAVIYDSTAEPEWMYVKKDCNVFIWNFVILNASIITFMSEAIAFGYSQILPSYLVIQYNVSQPESMDCLMVFLGFFCIGRIATTIFSSDYFLKSSFNIILFVSIFLLYCGVAVLYIEKKYDRSLFFIANGVIGVGVSPLFISNYLWLCCKVFVTHRSVNPLFIMESLSELIFPWLLSTFFWRTPETVPHFMVSATSITAVLYGIQYFCFAGTKKEKCSDCTRKSIGEAIPIPIIRRLNETVPNSRPQVPRSESSEDTLSLEFLKRGFINKKKVFDDFSEIEKRIQQTNKKVKSAISQLEYTVKS